jgi:hypothetical protein
MLFSPYPEALARCPTDLGHRKLPVHPAAYFTRVDYAGKWRYSSSILDLGTRWRLVVSFIHWPLYLQGNRPCTH